MANDEAPIRLAVGAKRRPVLGSLVGRPAVPVVRARVRGAAMSTHAAVSPPGKTPGFPEKKVGSGRRLSPGGSVANAKTQPETAGGSETFGGSSVTAAVLP